MAGYRYLDLLGHNLSPTRQPNLCVQVTSQYGHCTPGRLLKDY